ncbi:IclR family transcriptional regulator [Microbacterium sp. 2FI]|uniref:IclR family transcriptional regulator n=1 Tax=Microbacterium sp. 2FI TaxID=2502193 RepID=UPI001BB18FDA|nr:IclR family transcriptional regulator [Microbacterium sp. 2FI]
MAQTSGYRERNSTADRALNVLQMFTEERPELSAIDVAESLGVARSTAYRYLQTLVQSGFLAESGRGSFRLGLYVLELARIARKGFGLTELCVPVMRELAEQFHQTVLLTKLMGNAVVCLEREEAREQYVRLSYERGSVLDINAGASALVLLSAMEDDQARGLLASTPLKQFTPNTLTDAERIVARLAQIRSDGFAISSGEVDPTAMGVAAPIRRENGEVIAAISVVLIRSLVSESQIDSIVEALVTAAAALSTQAALLEL